MMKKDALKIDESRLTTEKKTTDSTALHRVTVTVTVSAIPSDVCQWVKLSTEGSQIKVSPEKMKAVCAC